MATTIENNDEGNPGHQDGPLECAVCLQTCIHPVQLPCRHIFCYLCVKGVSTQVCIPLIDKFYIELNSVKLYFPL